MADSLQGREALSTTVHLSVPRALKARWVKDSQQRGLKLTDHLLTMIERGEAMKTYPIPETLAAQYHGAGCALAATAVRELQALGQVHVGMCSAWEFCEL